MVDTLSQIDNVFTLHVFSIETQYLVFASISVIGLVKTRIHAPKDAHHHMGTFSLEMEYLHPYPSQYRTFCIVLLNAF